MLNDTVPAAALGLPDNRLSDVSAIIADMEDRVFNLVRWARLVHDLGCSPTDLSADGVFAVGRAMIADSQAVYEDWKQLFELTREVRRGGQ